MDKDEVIRTVGVDENKIICRTCEYRNFGMEYPHFTKGHCGIYRSGIAVKPSKILFEGGDCEYYKRDKTASP